ncbi:unnamed protein product [marine sediment metagenome]|uniref:Uncharacterized protein n=1 Tax=marine sediment metagenome TaxID=412755 RepID=X1FXX5_9ZZZZ
MADRVEPTKEQIQWLWEQCGFRHKYGALFQYPEDYLPIQPLPSIDSLEFMGFLFKYAVPKFLEEYGEDATLELLQLYWIQNVILNNLLGKEALALFWAIYKALGGK